MRILHVYENANFESGGVVRYIYDLGSGFARRGYTVGILTCGTVEEKDRASEEWGEQVRVESMPRIGFRGIFSNKKTRSDLARHLEDYAVVHIHGVWSVESIFIARQARVMGIPYVVTVHGMLDDWCMAQRGLKKRLYIQFLSNKMFKGASAVITSASKEREQASKWLPHAEMHVLPPVMDLEPFSSELKCDLAEQKFQHFMENDKPVVLFLSRIHEKKGVEILVRAMKILEQQGVGCTALIAGVGDESYVKSLKKLVADLGLEQAVHFIGMIDGDLKTSVYRRSDIFVLPTAQENFGLVFTESMACGTPVITTCGIDLCQELESSGGVVLCERTPRAFAENMKLLLSDPSRLQEMGSHGREWVFKEFSADKVLDKHESLYQRVAGRTK